MIAENQGLLDQLMSGDTFSKVMISVCHGSEFKKKCDISYELDLSNKTHFEQLFDSLVDEKITDVIRLYTNDKDEDGLPDRVIRDADISALRQIQI